MAMQLPTLVPTPARVAALDRLGDEIAELSAHLDAATARLLAPSANSTPGARGTRGSLPALPGSAGGWA